MSAANASNYDPDTRVSLTLRDYERNALYASIYGAVLLWSGKVMVDSLLGFWARRKLIYGLNLAQATLMFLKTLAAICYGVFLNLDCNARAYVLNFPLMLSVELVYVIMMFKLLLFTTYQRAVQGFYALGILAHMVVVMVAVAQASTSRNSYFQCANAYPLLYKQQYVVEVGAQRGRMPIMTAIGPARASAHAHAPVQGDSNLAAEVQMIIEAVTTVALLHGLIQRQTNDTFLSTRALLQQLRGNEELRVFWALLFITAKIVLTYQRPERAVFDITSITHGVDVARSALVCWALLREQRTVTRTTVQQRAHLLPTLVPSTSATTPTILGSMGKLAASNARLGPPSKSKSYMNVDMWSIRQSISISTRGSRMHPSRKGGAFDAKANAALLLSKGFLAGNVVVLDADGQDVTPLPLGQGGGGSKSKSMNHASTSNDVHSSGAVKENVSEFLNQLESQSMVSSSASSFGGEMATRHGGSSQASSSNVSADEDDEKSQGLHMEAGEKEEGTGVAGSKKGTKGAGSLPSLKPLPSTEAIDPNRNVHISIRESETLVLFDLYSLTVSNENEAEALALKDANTKYTTVLSALHARETAKSNLISPFVRITGPSRLLATAIKLNNDNYVSKASQTIKQPRKNKDVQVSAVGQADAEASVNNWILHDAMEELQGLGTGAGTEAATTAAHAGPLPMDAGAPGEGESALATQPSMQSLIQSGMASRQEMTTTGTMSTLNTSQQMSQQTSVAEFREAPAPSAAQANVIGGGEAGRTPMLESLDTGRLKSSLFLMERAIMSNIYDKKFLVYRNAPDAEAQERQYWEQIVLDDSQELDPNNPEAGEYEGAEGASRPNADTQDAGAEEGAMLELAGPVIGFLWSYRCEVARGRNVAGITWNRANDDIMAVAYGECKSSSTASAGLVLCWNVKNPEWPEKIYYADSPVTSLDFSTQNPVLLAAGFQDGHIAIYDLRDADGAPALENTGVKGTHHDPVWELKWVAQETSGGEEGALKGGEEHLVSVSTDGRVSKWVLHKGLEHLDLISLKSIVKGEEGESGAGAGAGAGKSSTSLLSRQSGGLCFDFHGQDANIYLVGTEDGLVHKCSSAYNEQYLASYFGHSGPVYKVKWCPFSPKTFMTCSSDWTIRLWDADGEGDIFRFQSGKTVIMDLAWSPRQATVFASVSQDGRLEVWDLASSVLDPVAVHAVIDRSLTCVRFGEHSQTLFTGDDNGAVNVYTLKQPAHAFPMGTDLFAEDAAAREREAARLNEVIRAKLHPEEGLLEGGAGVALAAGVAGGAARVASAAAAG